MEGKGEKGGPGKGVPGKGGKGYGKVRGHFTKKRERLVRKHNNIGKKGREERKGKGGKECERVRKGALNKERERLVRVKVQRR